MKSGIDYRDPENIRKWKGGKRCWWENSEKLGAYGVSERLVFDDGEINGDRRFQKDFRFIARFWS